MIFAYFLPFTVGLLGSLHCLGMCGPLVLAYSLQARNPEERIAPGWRHYLPSDLGHHLAFHGGRLLTYGFMGALASIIFGLVDLPVFFSGLRGLMTIAGGIFMMVIGLTLLRFLPFPALSGSAALPERIRNNLLPTLFNSRYRGAKLVLGILAGFLPCGLTWAMIAKAATARSIPGAFLAMISFGLGTVPVLLTAGLFTSLLSSRLRLIGERLAALAVLFMGIFLIVSGARHLA